MEYDLSYDDSLSLKQTLADLLRGMSKKQAYQEIGQGIQNTAKVIPSVVESLGRGAIAQVPGTFGDISELARQFAPETMQNVMGNRVAPTTEEILAKIPRLNPDYQGSSQHETIGGLISPAMPSLLRAGAKATQNMPIGNMIKKVEPVEYRGSHQPPSPDSDVKAFFHQMDMLMPKDVYSIKGKNIYGIGDQTIDSDWWKPMMKAKGNPNYEVEVYRAVPKGVTEINSGDWVSPSRKYVQDHGENALNGEYDIISKKVPASTLTSEGYPYELGYFQPTRKEILEQNFNKIAGGEKPVRSAVVLIGDKIFTGNTHTQAFEKAIHEGVVRKEGKKFIYPEGAEVNSDLFMLNDGSIVDRLTASRKLDVGSSEGALRDNKMQIRPANSMPIDEYMRQAKIIKESKK
jgi:hypothetical protein